MDRFDDELTGFFLDKSLERAGIFFFRVTLDMSLLCEVCQVLKTPLSFFSPWLFPNGKAIPNGLLTNAG